MSGRYRRGFGVAGLAHPDDIGPGPGLLVSGDPVPVAPGGRAPLTLERAQLREGKVYLGLVTYSVGSGPGGVDDVGESLVVVDRAGTSRLTSFGSRSSRKPL